MSLKSKKIQPKSDVSKLGFFDKNMPYIASNIPDYSKPSHLFSFHLTILNKYKMRHKHFYTIFLFFSFLCLTPTLAQTVVWDESVDGDLIGDATAADNNTLFQNVSLVSGVNIIRGLVGNATCNGTACDADAFSFTVPVGATITALDVSSYTLQNTNLNSAFNGYLGTPLVDAPASFIRVSAPQSLLSIFGGGGSLSPNQYGIGINEVTVEGTIYEVSITLTPNPSGGDVPTLSEWGLIVLALLLMTLGTLVLVQPNWREVWNRKD